MRTENRERLVQAVAIVTAIRNSYEDRGEHWPEDDTMPTLAAVYYAARGRPHVVISDHVLDTLTQKVSQAMVDDDNIIVEAVNRAAILRLTVIH